MLSIDDFRGDAGEAADFSIACWRANYAGRSFYPIWDRRYMDWQLFNVPDPGALCRLGAYSNGKLVGFFAAEKMTFNIAGQKRIGTMSSWLSVAADSSGIGVAAALRAAMWEWQRSCGVEFMVGFVNAGSLVGSGRKFWTRQVPNATLRRRPRIWGHVFDARNASAAEYSRLEAYGVRALAALQRAPAPAEGLGVRDYRDSDLSACQAIFERVEQADFAYSWSAERLAHQLSFANMAHTYVLDRGAGAEALFNFYPLELVGRSVLRCAVVDFIAAHPAAKDVMPRFIRDCLFRLRAMSFDAALTLGPPVYSLRALLAGGFMPLPAAQELIFLPVSDPACKLPAGSMHLHWR